jgi:glycosyltransferase involved in cell wall biosynthesis
MNIPLALNFSGYETVENKKNLLFIYPFPSSFVCYDQEILSKHFIVHNFCFGSPKGFSQVIRQVKMLYWLLVNIPRSQKIYIWFADYHAFLPAIFGAILKKKVILIIGGFDATYIPNLKYGVHQSFFRSLLSKISVRLADEIIPVSKFTGRSLLQHNSFNIIKKVNISYLGVPDSIFFPRENVIRKREIVSIIGADTLTRFRVKGGDILIELAKLMPSENFTIIGISENLFDALKNDLPSNINFINWIPNNEMPEVLSSYKVVCQLSHFEAFSMAMLEGMLCGCIPVSHKGIGPAEFIPKNSGFLAEDLDLKNLKSSLKKALNAPDIFSTNARQHALKNLNLLEREKTLISRINN